jgi:hypothetical protein
VTGANLERGMRRIRSSFLIKYKEVNLYKENKTRNKEKTNRKKLPQ